MNLVEQAFYELYPNRSFDYEISVKYSGKFKDYNANVKMYGKKLEFGLSRKWKGVSREIKMGLIQELFVSLFKSKKSTTNMELYNKFIKKLHLAVDKQDSEPMLEDSFNRVNDVYFNGLIESPNLSFGNDSRRVLGHYNYQTDAIVFSTKLRRDLELLDYVMYHELLHKKLKFEHKNGRSYHHTPEFKKLEREFRNFNDVEKRLKYL